MTLTISHSRNVSSDTVFFENCVKRYSVRHVFNKLNENVILLEKLRKLDRCECPHEKSNKAGIPSCTLPLYIFVPGLKTNKYNLIIFIVRAGFC